MAAEKAAAEKTVISEEVTITVSNAGRSNYNGRYEQRGTFHGRPQYYKMGGIDREMLLYSSSYGGWCLSDGGTYDYYKARSDSQRPPTEGWEVTSMGIAPAPTVR